MRVVVRDPGAAKRVDPGLWGVTPSAYGLVLLFVSLDRIAETDAALPVPDGAADETEIAIANDDPAGMGFLVAIRRWFAVMPERRKLVPAYRLVQVGERRDVGVVEFVPDV